MSRIENRRRQIGVSSIIFIFDRVCRIRMKIRHWHRHNFGGMADLITLFFQKFVKRRSQKRVDLEIRRGVVVAVLCFAVSDFFFDRDQGIADLFHTVSTVSIIMRKPDQPAVIKFNLVGWPGIQRDFLNQFHISSVFLHTNAPLSSQSWGTEYLRTQYS